MVPDRQQAVQRLECLNEIAKLLASFQTVEEAFHAVVGVAARILPLASAVLVEDVDGERAVKLWCAEGREPDAALQAEVHATAALSYLLGEAGVAVLVGSNGDPVLPGGPPMVAAGGRFIVLPLLVADRPVFGVLQLESPSFDKQDLTFVGALTNQFAVALDRDRAWRRDIARREHAEVTEATMRQQAEALIVADQQRSEFLSQLADELRGSLAASRDVHRTMREAPAGERADRVLRTLNLQIQHTAQLIDDLAGLSVMTREELHLRRERLEIGALLTRVAERGNERIAARSQVLSLSLPSGPVFLEADAVRIEQVFDTLIDKASLLASLGGRIWMSAELVAGSNGHGPLKGVLAGPQIVVTLRDDGAGKVVAILPRVFDLLSPTGREIDPTDVRLEAGLKVMRRIVEMHGGAVAANTSGFGQGSEFEVRLPIGGREAELLRPERRSS